MRKSSRTVGIVSLIGGGPGDPELLTLKGRRLLEHADAVVYDALVNPRLLDFCPRGAERIFAGKRGGRHALEQTQINRLLVKLARAGKRVCRLKGGDPFLFGRGGEEAEFLAKNRVPFEIVPGVSSVNAVPAAAGIPLTHRRHASSVTIATGHESEDGDESVLRRKALRKLLSDPEWARYDPKKTLLILMGFSRLSEWTGRLTRLGWPAATPAALLCAGTLPNSATVEGTLATLPRLVQAAKARVSPPAMILVGEVVRLRKTLAP